MIRGKQSIDLEAAEWAVRIDDKAFSARDAARFKLWIARSEEHRAAFLFTNRVWMGMDGLKQLEAYPDIVALLLAPQREASALSEAPAPDRRALLFGAGAAGLAACVVGYSVLAPGAAEAYATGIGEQREVALADGTRVFLNADSRIEARIAPGRREVRLISGEAVFVIAESDWGPFSIHTGAGEIEAPSGEVLVKLLPQGVRVGLLSEGARAARRGWFGRAAPVLVAAESEIVFDGEDVEIAPVASDQLARRTLWREGMLAFENTALAEAAADVARHTGMHFVFADPALADLRVGGLIRAGELDAFLQLLRDNLAVQAERQGDEIVLSSTATL